MIYVHLGWIFLFSNSMKHPVTVIIPTWNEEVNLPGCLDALGGSFEAVWVVDSGSGDGTREVAAARGAEVLDFEWNGRFPKKREWVLRNLEVRTPWVWFLDADERVNPRLLREVAPWLVDESCSGMSIPLRRWWGGRPLRFGRKERKTSLVRVGRAAYVPFPDDCWSPKDVETFEPVRVDGKVVEIRSSLDQRNGRGVEHFRAKLEHDVQWHCCHCLWLRSAPVEVWRQLDPAESARVRQMDAPWAGWEVWWREYLSGGGFLDGWAGWQYHAWRWRISREIRNRLLRPRR